MTAQNMIEFSPVLRNRDVHSWAGEGPLRASAIDHVLSLDLRDHLVRFISRMLAIVKTTAYSDEVPAKVIPGKEGEL